MYTFGPPALLFEARNHRTIFDLSNLFVGDYTDFYETSYEIRHLFA
jgi:hypothetical protein